ncbi:hypothetical protein A2Z00_00320 [Candidatus Gottesmanbacteria bacterium RBG_13_45_10]|uniref:SCP domain-containing protein n=1 Tax=Candidatus Gottesmanbacteria bacterium RBG_13_45_10 TaxID=1798370 RepID=A0A1F5ZHM7_9BACT|nr:MAG: hypothetical protein A2Z00_00320 [Candidatus Gottesmanbacteria bacterium RBG_13_45_10]
MQLNWVDVVIIAIVAYSAFRGWKTGLVLLFSNLISFIIALWLAIKFNGVVSGFLADKFGVPALWATVAGYIVVGFTAEVVLTELFTLMIRKIPDKLALSWVNNWLGALVSAVNGFLIVAFFILIISVLPLRGTVKNDIRKSQVGKYIVTLVATHGGPLQSTVNEVGKKATKFFTIEPGSKGSLTIDVAPKASDLHVDSNSEAQMVQLVNAERKLAGVPSLTVDSKITEVAREHSRDMFLRRYFSHLTPEGKDAGTRMENGGVVFTQAGENIAYTPDLLTAHQGLMDSEEHRKNILDPEFHRIGIGIISTDSFGMMVTQEFAN